MDCKDVWPSIDDDDEGDDSDDDEGDGNDDGHSVSKACWPARSIRGAGAWRIIPGLGTLQFTMRISVFVSVFEGTGKSFLDSAH